MSLLTCPECNGQVSSYAEQCPHCGIPKDMIAELLETQSKAPVEPQKEIHYQTVKFGRYPYEADGSIAPIEWLVVKEENNQILLISKNTVDSLPFSTALFEDGATAYVTWDDCSLRKFLNEDFYNQAFNAEEQARIIPSDILAEVNPVYYTPAGENTNDNVFLLNVSDVQKYFPTKKSRQCSITPYASVKQNGIEKDGKGWWWLRTPGSSRLYAVCVDFSGEIVSCGGTIDYKQNSIRPAIWIKK